jgi:hypothetical protein
MALSSGPAVVKRTESAPPARALAYEQQIIRPSDTVAAPEQSAPERHAMVPADAAPAETKADQASETTAAAGEGAEAPSAEDGGSSDMAALPHDGDVQFSDPNALPWQRNARPDPAMQGEGADASDPMAAQPGEDAQPQDPMAALPGDDSDPNAFPSGPEEEPQEWVQVLVSGAGMHGAASEDAPALFSFPYGRTLRVVSHYEGWVEVIDPQSATTGWMKSQYLAPIAAPGAPQETEAMYQDEQPRRRGWFRRHGGFGDMINRALGGGGQ